MDTGPTFAQVRTPIGADETAGELGERLATLAAESVREWLPRFVAGSCSVVPQDGADASVAPILEKEHGRIAWAREAGAVHDHVRGMNPWPGAFTTARGRTLKVHATRVVLGAITVAAPGSVVLADKSRVLVACGGGRVVELVTVQADGRRAMRATDWSMGHAVAEGDVLG
jgi:methionyl-tRNA formyltransferase